MSKGKAVLIEVSLAIGDRRVTINDTCNNHSNGIHCLMSSIGEAVVALREIDPVIGLAYALFGTNDGELPTYHGPPCIKALRQRLMDAVARLVYVEGTRGDAVDEWLESPNSLGPFDEWAKEHAPDWQECVEECQHIAKEATP